MLFATFTKVKKIIQILVRGKRSRMLSKHYFIEYLKTKWWLLKTYFIPSSQNLITRLVQWMQMNLYEKTRKSEKVTVICGIKNIHLLAQRFFVLLHLESYQRFLELMQQSVLGCDIKKIKYGKISAIHSDEEEKQIIVYTSTCIKSARI